MSSENPIQEKREFFRYRCEKPVSYKIVLGPRQSNPASKAIEGISKNLSASGILFTSSFIPEISSILRLELDYRTTNICREIEEQAVIVGNSLIGKVVRIEDNDDGRYNVGVAFIKKSEDLPTELRSIVK